MVEERMRRIKNSIIKLQEEVEKADLRKIEGDMHKCSASCYDNDIISLEKVHNCLENCKMPLKEIKQCLQEEVRRSEYRWRRCVASCYYKVTDKLGSNPTDAELPVHVKEIEKCLTECTDDYCKLFPTFEQVMKKVQSNREYKESYQ